MLERSEIPSQDISKEEYQSVERLVLGAGRAVPGNRQVREEPLDLLLSHILRVPLAMKYDEAMDPAEVVLLSGITQVSETNSLTNHLHKSFRLFFMCHGDTTNGPLNERISFPATLSGIVGDSFVEAREGVPQLCRSAHLHRYGVDTQVSGEAVDSTFLADIIH